MRAYLSEVIGDKFPIISNTEVRITNWKDYGKFLNCELFTVVTVEYKDMVLSIFVDDEGLLKPNFGRVVKGYPEPLFGNMIITGGVDSEGNTMKVPDKLSLMDLEELINGIEYQTKG